MKNNYAANIPSPSKIENFIWFVKRLGMPHHYLLKIKNESPISVETARFGHDGKKYAWNGGWRHMTETRFSPLFSTRILCLAWGLLQFRILWRPDKTIIDYSHPEMKLKNRFNYGIIMETIRKIKSFF